LSYSTGLSGIDRHLELEEGTNLLVTGSATGKDDVVRRIVSAGIEGGEGVVYVTTKDEARDIVGGYSGYDLSRFAVVDCVSESQRIGGESAGGGGAGGDGGATVRTAGSPSDMTGIGIEVSDLLEEFWERRGIERNRVCLESVSTLLMYSDLQTVFRFLHVFTGRIRSVGGLGVFVMEPEMHDEKDISTLRQLFDGRLEVRDDDGVRVRAVGLSDEPTDWFALD
jgi:KaiC/GvpD/RAD55 family RecA-like ATPase